ncbi:putative bifunctional diguanylate cyclase/phosphodiesterase [Novosphingobium mangrovi (ex Huang et al. 2023)]|uniref:EAL domain-containing protein n=1 Tax=Novosphingobium mangrovi (ex Huang et al. 2023) TaxID=2976432 RepID=A0ABT2I6X1_9SPHN|nr:EAL domain-containing protein [Novosphingobium mangrovi (ex Huang et al. 2023)]MCT2400563.1 EAL domain-containing protein [Novosphingobium mangrovi (ex Huang et al. 2023)]
MTAGNIAFRDEAGESEQQIDVVALGIVTAAILMFVATGSEVGPRVVDSLLDRGPGPDNFILNAFLLNIAIIIFGWSRYRQLSAEIRLRRASERQARQMAQTDPLTGFLNRRNFNERVDKLIDTAEGNGQAVVLIMIDLDNFKQVNDFNGHSTGDVLLRECSHRIGASLPKHAVAGRIGGDEFAAAFAFDKSRDETIDQIATGLVKAISESTKINAISIEVTASIGLARSDVPDVDGRKPDALALLEMADIAMYHAKRQGRNSFFWFEGVMADEMRFRNELEMGIRQGIPRGEFLPYYEQQIDLQTGELTGFEMLARWDSPHFGLVSPEIFIPVAEDIGAIAALSESVIRQALEDAKDWDPKLGLSVNISPVQLRDPWFAQKLLRMLVEANFPPHRLEIEITESCLHQNLPQARSLITSLKNQGIKVTLDDFGTGYSSLAQLRSLPFDRIKIDRSFVTSLIENKDNAAIVHAIAMLGKDLELPVTAEGIESSEVLKHLLQYGHIKGQGYLYGHPRPAGELSELLREHATSPIRSEPVAVAAPAPDKASPVPAGIEPAKDAHAAPRHASQA